MFCKHVCQCGAVSIMFSTYSDTNYILSHNHSPTIDAFVLCKWVKISLPVFICCHSLLLAEFSFASSLDGLIPAQGGF